MKRRVGWLVLLAVLGGCVEETDTSLERGPEPVPASAVQAEAIPPATRIVASLTEWTIVLSHPEAAAGTLSIDVANNGSEVHAVEIRGEGLELRSDPIQPGESVTMSVVLDAGTYDVYCPMASGGEAHADRGMRTSLRVR